MPPLKTAAFALICLGFAGPALADCDIKAAEKIYRKCKSCHQIGEGAESRIGPALNGIVGAEIASVEGFSYSDAFLEKKAAGLVWTDEELDAYLEKPKDHIPGTKMSFAGVRKEDERATLICYLKGFD